MNLKKGILFVLTLISIFLVGCRVVIDSTVEDLEKALIIFNEASAIEMNYRTTVETNNNSVSTDSKMILTSDGDRLTFYIQAIENNKPIEMYYVDGYLYTETNQSYKVLMIL